MIKNNPMLKVFKIKDMSKFLLGASLTSIGQSAMSLTLIWFIYNQTKSPFLIAISLITLELPSIIVAPLIAFVLDRYSVVKVIYLTNLLRAILFVYLFFANLTTVNSYVIFFTILGISSAVLPLSKSGENIIITELTPKEYLVAVNSLMNIQIDFSLVIGPVLALGLINLFSEKVAYLVNAFFLILSAHLYLQIKIKYQENKKNKQAIFSFKRWVLEIKKGLSFTLKNKQMSALIIIFFLWNLLLWGTLPVLSPIISETYLSGLISYSIMSALLSGGIVCSSFLIGLLPFKNNMMTLVFLSICLNSILYCCIGLINNVSMFGLIFFLMGLVSAPALIYSRTIFQLIIPKEQQGSVFTLVGSLSAAGYPLGAIIAANFISWDMIEVKYLCTVFGVLVLLFSLPLILNIRKGVLII